MDLKSRRVKIAVIDTGVSLSHGGIQAAYQKRRIRKEWCRSWVGSPSDIGDHDGHGTHMAHLLHRVAPEADIYVAKVFRGSSFDMAEAENIAQVGRPFGSRIELYELITPWANRLSPMLSQHGM